MITPRHTRLVGVSDLRTFRETVVGLVDVTSVAAARRCAVLVPSRAAGEQLRRAFEEAHAEAAALVLPHIVTPCGWLDLLASEVPDMPPGLGAAEREVLLESSARLASAAGFAPPFRLRPGLVREMIAFYDAIRRHGRGCDDLEHAASEAFSPYLDTDSGASRMLAQAQFLVETFRRYEARVAGSGRSDEHGVRERLLGAVRFSVDRAVVAVGDATGDLPGLWPADFDLLTRMPGLARIDVVATQAALAAGLLPRLRRWLPGLEEERHSRSGRPAPALQVPTGSSRLHACYRDREEELAAIAREIKAFARRTNDLCLSRIGIIFRRPLPYVYLASRLLAEAGLPFEAFDALPLAAEPPAAALDLVLTCAESDFQREAVVAILASPHFACGADGRPVSRHDTAALDRALSESRFLGGGEELLRLAETWLASPGADARASERLRRAAAAVTEVVHALAPLAAEPRPVGQLDGLLRFLDRFEREPGGPEEVRARQTRARAAVRIVLCELRDAHLAWNDDACPLAETATRIRRWIEQRTFAPRSGEGGVQLLDVDQARFASLDCAYLVGVVESDWPQRWRRNIFFPASFLKNLGWPDEVDARAETRALFDDLVGLARARVSVSSFELDNDALVDPSPLLDGLDRLGLARADADGAGDGVWMRGDGLEQAVVEAQDLPDPIRAWVRLRRSRTPAADARFHGRTSGGGRTAYRVSAVDRYLDCPFQYFASDVLRLSDEPDDEAFLGPRERGRLTHDALQRFFEAWQADDRGALSVENLPDARALFASVVDDLLSRLSQTDAALERPGLLGSAVAVGVGEIVFQHEIERPAAVVERLLEFPLDGPTDLRDGPRVRQLTLKARADRVDLLADGTFRLIDYKLSHAPDVGRAVQLPAYAAAVRARLAGHRGRDWRASDAAYVTFGRPPHTSRLANEAATLDAVLAEGEARFVKAVEQIEAGVFPPRPTDRRLCASCPYSAVCRKDYVDEA